MTIRPVRSEVLSRFGVLLCWAAALGLVAWVFLTWPWWLGAHVLLILGLLSYALLLTLRGGLRANENVGSRRGTAYDIEGEGLTVRNNLAEGAFASHFRIRGTGGANEIKGNVARDRPADNGEVEDE